MESSKTWIYQILEIIYNIYEDNTFHNKKEIKFVSITALSFIKDTAYFGHCMEFIDAAVKKYHIKSLQKQLDKVGMILFMTLMRIAS